MEIISAQPLEDSFDEIYQISTDMQKRSEQEFLLYTESHNKKERQT